MTVIIFGDSIVNRANDTGGGWVSRLWNHIYQHHNTEYAPGVVSSNHSVIELGIGGDDIVGINSRLESELQPRLKIEVDSDRDQYLVGIAVGVNDSRIDIQAGNPHIDIEVFRKTYLEVVEKLKNFGVYVFLVGISPSDESRMNPCPWTDPPTAYINDSIEGFNSCVKEIAESNQIDFVDVLSAFQKRIELNGPDTLLGDGIHPNEEGHQLIADLVYEKIKYKL